LAKLGSSKRPAVVRVQSFDEAERILALCDERGWKVVVGVEPGEPEDLSDLHRLLGSGEANPGYLPPPAGTRRKVGRNAPCPCGSGLKYKRCCVSGSGEAVS